MTIDELINRYFEGETSAGEERRLRAFFREEEVPPHLAPYRALFACFEEEIRLRQAGQEAREAAAFDDGIIPPPSGLRRKTFRRVFYAVAGLAASVLLVLGGARLLRPVDPCFCSANYVVVNGRCYTDIGQVRALAREALEEVAASDDDYFPLPDAGDDAGRALMEEQWEEMRALFNDND